VIDTRNPACDEMFDTVVQSLFGTGLRLEKCIESTDDLTLAGQLDASIRGLHDIIALISNRGQLHCDTGA
jgi:hypothetical protein